MRYVDMLVQRLEERDGKWIMVVSGAILEDDYATGETLVVELPAQVVVSATTNEREISRF